ASTVNFDDATPITGILRSPRLVMEYSAGKIFLYARSPVIPKNTSASEGTRIMGSSMSGIGPPGGSASCTRRYGSARVVLPVAHEPQACVVISRGARRGRRYDAPRDEGRLSRTARHVRRGGAAHPARSGRGRVGAAALGPARDQRGRAGRGRPRLRAAR